MTYTVNFIDCASTYFEEENYCGVMTFVDITDRDSVLLSPISDIVTAVGTDSKSIALTFYNNDPDFVTETTTFNLTL